MTHGGAQIGRETPPTVTPLTGVREAPNFYLENLLGAKAKEADDPEKGHHKRVPVDMGEGPNAQPAQHQF